MLENILEITANVLLIVLVVCVTIVLILSERRDMQNAKEDIGCVWVETGGDTMVRECK